MNIKGKILVIIVLSLVSISFLFSGCGTAPASADPKVITVAVDDSYPPMEYRDDKNNLVGFDVDLANALSEKLGIKFEFKSVGWDGIFSGLEAGNYDCIISSVSMTKERLETMDFTAPYLANGQVIVVKPGDTSIKTAADIVGKTVGVQVSTTADTAVTKQQEKEKFEIKRYDEIIQTFDSLTAGHIDCIVVDYAVAIDYQAKFPDKFAITTAQLTNEPIAVCFKKGNALLGKFQKALDEVKSEGKLTELSKKWFGGKDFTSNIDTNLY